MPPKAILLDPSIGSPNVGDQIIAEGVLGAFGSDYFSARLSTHKTPSFSLDVPHEIDVAVVGGTNLLNGNRPYYRQWKVGRSGWSRLKQRVVLMGVGWWQYQEKINFASRRFYEHLLMRDAVHSVRDDYTAQKLTELGYSVVNTGCPTTWSLGPDIFQREPTGESAILTLTNYNKNPVADSAFLDAVGKSYKRVAFWPQSAADVGYVKSLSPGLQILPPTLRDYDHFLATHRPDYFGTRLHGGIRAMQHGLFTKIIVVDNRAAEMGKDFGVPVISRKDAGSSSKLVSHNLTTPTVPRGRVSSWLSQDVLEVPKGLRLSRS